ncbi:Lipocalins domain-containing protein [Dioscorea alata]|uniref:Lipocalins domain-containing protein n=4 Tax=Dioscorea alata TaxID=55571 RepID=A0ACB7UJZ6_DIOAL|nr:Lipocalins domain-containing protein [Dioscorea alata]KAH7660735.1 Lipocalins domain-containing protein [Dioscorea alata]KAH7660736.1 Lipocalins domain-containing protein [Dioscorea alata]KAH7660737.1 Lipocalins domain-containing protein [Dioscorea alata]
MASIARISIPPPMAEGLSPKSISRMLSSFPKSRLSSSLALVTPIRSRRLGIRAAGTPSPAVEEEQKQNDESMSIDALHRFFDLNVGNWNGSFYQFDANGNILQNVSTKLAVSTYGEDELISLIQSLYIKQPPSRTSIAGDEEEEPEWLEYKIKETNMFTVDKYQQIGFFPKEKAFALRYQTAGMLETVLRAGVLGEDDTGEESPKNLKIPSRRPSVVCENCLYSLNKDMRTRAFHIMDPKGVLEMLLIFLEERGGGMPAISSPNKLEGTEDRLTPMLGRWEGHSITKRSGVYGATIAEADTVALLELDDKGQLIQDITSTTSGTSSTTNVAWTGVVSNNLVTFDGGFQLTLMPGGMYMGCPCDIAKSVAHLQSFHLEFCWMESPNKRQRLVRTFDVEGLAVSSTYFYEVKV